MFQFGNDVEVGNVYHLLGIYNAEGEHLSNIACRRPEDIGSPNYLYSVVVVEVTERGDNYTKVVTERITTPEVTVCYCGSNLPSTERCIRCDWICCAECLHETEYDCYLAYQSDMATNIPPE